MRMTPFLTAVAAASALALSGCGSGSNADGGSSTAAGPAGVSGSSGQAVDAAALRVPASFDYDVLPTLTEVVDLSGVAVSGRIVSWSEGRSVVQDNTVYRYAVVAVEVEQASKVADPSQREVAYFSIDRGGELLNADGTPFRNPGAPSTVRTIEELERAAPVGVRVIMMGDPTGSVEEQELAPSVTVESPDAGLPDGATLVTPDPQGFVLETADGGFESGIVDTEDLEAWAAEPGASSRGGADASAAPGSFEALLAELADTRG